MGFLSTGDKNAPGNYGLHDQVLALKWIQENIAQFGGNPSQVTIAGQSAGSAMTHLHMFSPLSKGLFSRGISMSGTAASYWASQVNLHEDYAKEMGRHLNCTELDDSKKLIECLRKTEATEFLKAQAKTHQFFQNTHAQLPMTTSVPRIDKEASNPFMPVSPLTLLRQDNFVHKPWIFGLTSQEGAWYTPGLFEQKSMEYLQEFDSKTEDILINGFFKGLTINSSLAMKALNLYTHGHPVANQSMKIPLSDFAGDLLFNIESLLAVHHASKKGQVYFYIFNKTQNADYGGLPHGAELKYLW